MLPLHATARTRAHIEAEVGVTTTILQQKYTPLHATVYAILYYKIRTLFNTETDILAKAARQSLVSDCSMIAAFELFLGDRPPKNS